ncbi:MAG TPA: PAS domain S-box protein, partial [Candidatus Methylomirabilis sp.]|nr:PAS domain S-box protein [Candidatus Methylomirabilis sp.]
IGIGREVVGRRKDGSTFPLDLAIDVFRLGEDRHFTGIVRDITERKRAEQALRESEERFRGTFENAAVGIAHVDADGRFLLVNDRLCDIVGHTREELLAKGFQDITHPEDLATSLDHFHSLVRGELPSYSLEKRYLRGDGSVVWGNVSLSIQNRSAGEPAYGIAILQDISELKKVEEELRRASERLELAVRSSNVALGEWDMTAGPNGRVEWLNYWEQWGTGNPEDYPTADSMISLVHPEDRDEVARLTEAYVSGEVKEFKSVHRVQHRDGSYHWALAQGMLFRDAQGRPIRSSGSVIDINDLKQAEENLRESEERFRGTFENAAVGIAHMDSQNRCLRANQKLSEILGYPSEELVGKTLQDVVHPDDLEPNLALFDLLVRGDLPSFSMEKRFIRRDGAVVWTQVTASVQPKATGEPTFCIAIVQDISERKRLEVELSQAHARLELAVRGSNVRIWDVDMPD